MSVPNVTEIVTSHLLTGGLLTDGTAVTATPSMQACQWRIAPAPMRAPRPRAPQSSLPAPAGTHPRRDRLPLTLPPPPAPLPRAPPGTHPRPHRLPPTLRTAPHPCRSRPPAPPPCGGIRI